MSDATLKLVITGEDRSGSKALAGVGDTADSTSHRIASAAKMIGAAFVTAGGFALATGIKTAAGMETAEIAFGTMLGSADKAKKFLGDLSAFAARTPFELPELQTAAQSLVSIGINADKVIPIMTTLGNVTSGMGTGSEGVKRATVALQQMNAAGRITAEDLNQLRDAGIPVYELLARATGKSVAQVAALAQTGKLGRQELDQMMKALESGKGLERFNGMMEKQSASLAGLWSTLKDTFSVGTAQAIQPIIPLLKDGLGGAIDFLTAQMPRMAQGMRSGVDIARRVIGQLKAAFSQVQGTGFFASLAAAAGSFAGALPSLMPLIDATSRGLQFMADHADLVGRALAVGVAAWVAYKGAQALNNAVGRNSIIGFGLQLAATVALAASNFALASSQRSLAASQALSTSATNAGTLSRIRGAVATVASTAATTAASVASKAWAAAQWLLNAALTANPIGIVILALAAAAALLIYAYKKSETFRAVVDGAFRAVASVATWFWNSVMAPVIRFLINGFASVADWIGNMLDALSHIPGFGWAKTAADKMHGAARKAAELAGAIRDIKSKTVSVTVDYKIAGSVAARQAAKNRGEIGALASGGPADRNRPYFVGEEGMELFVPSTSGYVVNATDTAALLAGGGGRNLAESAGASEASAPLRIDLDGVGVWQGLLRVKRTRNGGLALGLG